MRLFLSTMCQSPKPRTWFSVPEASSVVHILNLLREDENSAPASLTRTLCLLFLLEPSPQLRALYAAAAERALQCISSNSKHWWGHKSALLTTAMSKMQARIEFCHRPTMKGKLLNRTFSRVRPLFRGRWDWEPMCSTADRSCLATHLTAAV